MTNDLIQESFMSIPKSSSANNQSQYSIDYQTVLWLVYCTGALWNGDKMFLTSFICQTLLTTNATERFFRLHYYQRGFFLKIVAISSADIYSRLILNTALYTCQLVWNYPCGQHKIAFYFRQKVTVQVKTPNKLEKQKKSLKITV